MNDKILIELGQLIKHHRLQRNFKQDDLAVGICTPSYLSRIENGVVIADEAIYRLLLERLQIDLDKYIGNQQYLDEQLDSIFEKILSHQKLTEHELSLFSSSSQTMCLNTTSIKYEIVYCRYLLSLNDIKLAKGYLAKIHPLINWQPNRVTQMYLLTISNYYLQTEQYSALIELNNKYQSNHYFNHAKRYEYAFYLYNLALAYDRRYQFHLALKYINAASDAFTHHYSPLFQLNLYLLKAGIYNDLNQFERAIVEYDASLELVSHVPNLQTATQLSSIYNNLAYCYECQGAYSQAIEHYQKALAYHTCPLTVTNLIRTFYRNEEIENVKCYIKKYKGLLTNALHQEYQLEVLSYVTQEDIEITVLKALEEKALSYFETQQYYALVLFYAPLFAHLYKTLHAYKNASNCYERAFYASEKARKRMS
ncbi:tetratricopeptide repeat protein [Lysinibacillus sp. NPDC097195]|uniref:helix-turn-helix domain-containing protein n=1 Tax=Lysinibacillus sp. NPDC097195 TaxID=3364141 RepID=UPI0038193CF8